MLPLLPSLYLYVLPPSCFHHNEEKGNLCVSIRLKLSKLEEIQIFHNEMCIFLRYASKKVSVLFSLLNGNSKQEVYWPCGQEGALLSEMES